MSEIGAKVVWREGMFLQPQHFQLAEHYLCSRMDLRQNFCSPYGNGISKLVLNDEAVANGTLALSACAGIMPDGTPFSLPESGPLPVARSFADHFQHDQQSLTVYLALPLAMKGAPSVTAGQNGGGHQGRFKSAGSSIEDETTGAAREIETGQLNFQLLFEQESRDNRTVLPLARLKRSAEGSAVVDKSFVPPLLRIGASPYLTQLFRQLLELLFAKSSSLSQGRKQSGGGFAQFEGKAVGAAGLLQTVNTYAPLLQFFQQAGTAHPYECYTVLMQLAGALCTYSSDIAISQLPHYNHGTPDRVFNALTKMIRNVLTADVSEGVVNVAVEQIGPATYQGKIPDERLLSGAQFYLGISAPVPEKELVVATVQRLKMCSRDRLELLVPSAMPGLPLIHTNELPQEFPSKQDHVYFVLDQRGELWEGIRTSGTLAFYFPHNYPNLKMELLALKR
jgi:type VI secretion system protein ImpJ